MSERDVRRPAAAQLVSAVEAVLFAADEPVAPHELAAAFGGIDLAEVEDALSALERDHEQRPQGGLRLERVAGGVRLVTRPEIGEWLRQFFRQRNRTRLSAAALETLAIVAYRQPVTVPEIQAIRAKDPTAAIKGLLDRKLIRTLGRKKVVGSPLLYGTGRQFLIHFGLDSLEDLPAIDDFEPFLEALRQTQPQEAPGAADESEPAADATDALFGTEVDADEGA